MKARQKITQRQQLRSLTAVNPTVHNQQRMPDLLSGAIVDLQTFDPAQDRQ